MAYTQHLGGSVRRRNPFLQSRLHIRILGNDSACPPPQAPSLASPLTLADRPYYPLLISIHPSRGAWHPPLPWAPASQGFLPGGRNEPTVCHSRARTGHSARPSPTQHSREPQPRGKGRLDLPEPEATLQSSSYTNDELLSQCTTVGISPPNFSFSLHPFLSPRVPESFTPFLSSRRVCPNPGSCLCVYTVCMRE